MFFARGRKFVFSGYYGMQSFGDDLFAWAAVRAGKAWGDAQVCINSPPLLGLEAKYTVPKFLDTVYLSHTRTGTSVRLMSSTISALTAERLLFFGGSIYSDARLSVKAITERFASHRVSAAGVSIGPFSNIAAERRVAKALSKYEYVAVRDKASYEWLEANTTSPKICWSADLAAVLEFPERSRSAAERLKIGFAPCNWQQSDIGSPKAACEKFLDAMRSLKSTVPIEVTIFNLNDHPLVGDRKLCEKVLSQLRRVQVEARLVDYRAVGVANTVAEISSQVVMVSGRMHGAISAYLSGVPFVLLEYHRKCADFCEFVGQPEARRVPMNEMDEAIIHAANSSQEPIVNSRQYSKQAWTNITAAPWYAN